MKNFCIAKDITKKKIKREPTEWEKGIYLVAQMVKSLPAMWETWVWSLGWEDPLEEGMATHSSILAWRIPWTEEPGGLQSTGSQRVGHDWAPKHSTEWEKVLAGHISDKRLYIQNILKKTFITQQ